MSSLSHWTSSQSSAEYKQQRPRYPKEVYEALRRVLPLSGAEPSAAVTMDVGCGSGQVLVDLAPLCGKVVGVDPSQTQLDAVTAPGAPPMPGNVSLVCAGAEDFTAPDGPHSVALVTVASALHWFKAAAFAERVAEALAPGGCLAVWTPGDHKFTPPEGGEVIEELRKVILSHGVDNGFQGIPNDPWYAEQAAEIEANPRLQRLGTVLTQVAYKDLTPERVAKFVSTTSIFVKYREARQEGWPDVVADLQAKLAALNTTLSTVSMCPVHLFQRRHPGDSPAVAVARLYVDRSNAWLLDDISVSLDEGIAYRAGSGAAFEGREAVANMMRAFFGRYTTLRWAVTAYAEHTPTDAVGTTVVEFDFVRHATSRENGDVVHVPGHEQIFIDDATHKIKQIVVVNS